MAQIRKLQDVVIWRHDDYYCGPGPAAVAFPDGEMMVFFRRHRSWTPYPLYAHVHPTTEMCYCRSADGGQTWSAPQVFIGGGQCAGASLLADGTVLFTTHRTEVVPQEMMNQPPDQDVGGVGEGLRRRHGWGYLAAGTEFWRSADRGQTWAGPFWAEAAPDLPPPQAPGLRPPLQHRGFPVTLRDGTLVMTTQARGVGSILIASRDGGCSWQFRGVAAPIPPGEAENAFNEWTVFETPSGALVGFVRSAMADDPRGGHLYTVRSTDGGRTWTPPQRRKPWGFPYFPLPLASGGCLLINGYRRPPFGIRCRILDPECANVDEAAEFVLRADGAARDLGYPHATHLPDGRILVVYYFHDQPDGQRFVAGSFITIEA